MKRLFLISAGIIVVLSLGAYISFSGNKASISSESSVCKVHKQSENKKDGCCCSHKKMNSGKISDNSIYQLESVWKNENNENVKLSDFKGNHVVLAMIFANCTYACPIIINDMKRIESKIDTKELKETKFVLVSIDPDRDTPEALRNLSKRQNLDPNRWTLLTGTKDNVRELAALFGFKYQKNEQGDYVHSNLINILNEGGEISYQYQGLNEDVTLAAEKLNSID